ncbi:MAG: 3-phosphoshikimate 1-carboxyvinyltransferase [Ferruginibacter sp.]
MMIARISPGYIKGAITAPASKSAMQRACALALLHRGKTVIQNPGNSNDDLAALRVIQALGAEVVHENGAIVVLSDGEVKGAGIINCGESGLAFRMFAPIAALASSEITLTGEGSLLKRRMHFFDTVFPQLGVEVSSQNGFLPIRIKGPLTAKDITIDGSSSSQYLTGLLFAFGKTAGQPVEIKVENLKSKPYVDLSILMMKLFGFDCINDGYLKFKVQYSGDSQTDIFYTTEGDWSGAAFLLVAGAIRGEVKLRGLDMASQQADRAIVQVLQSAGASVNFDNNCLHVKTVPALKGFEFDATDCPDLFPPLAALAAYCTGRSVIKGVTRLASKESNRAETLLDVFSKMGAAISIEGDTMIIEGGKKLVGTTVSSHHDHRIAMAAAIAALGAEGVTLVEDAGAVNKSYPDFYLHLRFLGATVSLTQ